VAKDRQWQSRDHHHAFSTKASLLCNRDCVLQSIRNDVGGMTKMHRPPTGFDDHARRSVEPRQTSCEESFDVNASSRRSLQADEAEFVTNL
jgi:hypothetical protein